MKTKLFSVLVIAAFVAATGCKKDDKGKKPETDKPATGKTTEKPPETPPEAKKWTADDTMKLVDDMTAAWNAGDWDKVGSFYADNVKMTFVDYVPPMEFTSKKEMMDSLKKWLPAFSDNKMQPQLVLVNGNNYAVIGLATSKNTGDFMGMKATNKDLSAYGAVIGRVDDKGKIVAERHLEDQATTMAQLGLAPNPMAPASEEPWPEVVKAKATASEDETKNVEMARKAYEALGNKDIDAVGAMIADDATFRWVPDKEVARGKEAYMKGLKEYLDMHESLTKTVKESWAAGDWLVSVVETKGKLAKDMPGFKGTKGKEYTNTQFEFVQIADGKVKTHWVFDNALSFMTQIGAVDMSKMMPGGGGDAAKAPAKAPAKK